MHVHTAGDGLRLKSKPPEVKMEPYDQQCQRRSGDEEWDREVGAPHWMEGH